MLVKSDFRQWSVLCHRARRACRVHMHGVKISSTIRLLKTMCGVGCGTPVYAACRYIVHYLVQDHKDGMKCQLHKYTLKSFLHLALSGVEYCPGKSGISGQTAEYTFLYFNRYHYHELLFIFHPSCLKFYMKISVHKMKVGRTTKKRMGRICSKNGC